MPAAVWFATVFPYRTEIPSGLGSPKRIQRWFNKQTADAALPAELKDTKDKANRKEGQKFSEWVQEMFPGLTEKTASDAIWWATNSGSLPEIPSGWPRISPFGCRN